MKMIENATVLNGMLKLADYAGIHPATPDGELVTAWIGLVVLTVILAEILYYFGIKYLEKERNSTLAGYSIAMKLLCLMVSTLVIVILATIMPNIVYALKIGAIVLSLIVITGCYFWLNYLLAKRIYPKRHKGGKRGK